MIKHCLGQNRTSIVIQPAELRSSASFILSSSCSYQKDLNRRNGIMWEFFRGGDHDPQNLMSSYKAREDPAKPCVDNSDSICREVDNDR